MVTVTDHVSATAVLKLLHCCISLVMHINSCNISPEALCMQTEKVYILQAELSSFFNISLLIVAIC